MFFWGGILDPGNSFEHRNLGLEYWNVAQPINMEYIYIYMGVSINGDTPKSMVYDGKSIYKCML
jgi:hypothetical protein